jgi:ubiquinone/menaquinone biosynthesis C-methylase UbiE
MDATIPAAPAPAYALDSAWHAERDRLNSLTRLYDAGTLEVVDRLGITAGWHCLEVGAGTGSLAQRFAELVAPTGSVTALDVDTRFLAPLASEHLHVAQADVTRDPLPEEEFDLVHARLLLEHLPQRDAVLATMARAAKPGGWVLIEDFDWSTASMVDPPSATHDKVAGAIRELFIRHGYTPSYGRRLPRALAEAGLSDVTTRAQAVQVTADRDAGVPQWELLADQFGPALLAAGAVGQDDLDAFHELWHDGDTICFSPLMVSVWGRR